MLLPFPGGAEALLLLILALVLEAAIGDSRLLDRLLPRPASLAGRLAAWGDRRLNRIERSDRVRRGRGLLLLLLALLAALAVGTLLAVLARAVAYGWLIELLLLMRALDMRRAHILTRDLLALLSAGGTLDSARKVVQPLTDRQVWSLDAHGVVRAALEGYGRALLRGLVGPLFFYGLLGLPGLLGWLVVLGMAERIGHATPRYQQFGAPAAMAWRLAGALPARLSALALALAALFVPRASARGALRTAFAAAPRHPAGPSAWPMAALAGALDLSLAGPRREGELVVPEPWLGEGRARARPADLRPALVLLPVALLLTVLVAGSLGLALVGGLVPTLPPG